MTDIDVRSHGATGDGLSSDTAAINAAILACHQAGGGRVRLSPGRYRSGTVRMASGVCLYVDAGARLIGDPDPAAYVDDLPPNWDGPVWQRARWQRGLIIADGCHDIAIQGEGVIDGNKVFDPEGEEKQRGPHTINLRACTGVTVSGVHIVDSANYAMLFQGGGSITVREVVVDGGWDALHYRGWNGIYGNGLSVTNCRFHCGDDAIAGMNFDDILIADCVLNSSCNCVRQIGPARGLRITGCHMYGPGRHPHRTYNNTATLAGINLQPGGWGPAPGTLSDVHISRCSMDGVSTPFCLVLKHPNDTGRVVLNQISAVGVRRFAVSIESWSDTPWTEVELRDIDVSFAPGCEPCDPNAVVEAPHVDARPLPAWGLYARGVTRLTLDRIRLSREDQDQRPALHLEQIEHLRTGSIQVSPSPGGTLRQQAITDHSALFAPDAIAPPS
ncbi:MAG: glycosyl hydrolase family 28-related protein [Planctomycetota bacterium]|jgi:hypothetical protein|nr:glycosyl hydrolase family 28-related protein [Planctomycetota bacterium]